jgi:hypothetical protein
MICHQESLPVSGWKFGFSVEYDRYYLFSSPTRVVKWHHARNKKTCPALSYENDVICLYGTAISESPFTCTQIYSSAAAAGDGATEHKKSRKKSIKAEKQTSLRGRTNRSDWPRCPVCAHRVRAAPPPGGYPPPPPGPQSPNPPRPLAVALGICACGTHWTCDSCFRKLCVASSMRYVPFTKGPIPYMHILHASTKGDMNIQCSGTAVSIHFSLLTS